MIFRHSGATIAGDEPSPEPCHIQGMVTKQLKRPRDPIVLAKLIGDIATGQVEDAVEDTRNQAAVQLGKKGGAARARKLTEAHKREIAKKAARARWK